MTRAGLLPALFLLTAAGCAGWRPGTTRAAPPPGLPGKYEVRVENVLLKSDVPVAEGGPLVAEIARLRADVFATLRLPPPARDVTVYLFEDAAAYQAYMDAAHPGLPARRAYFVGGGRRLSVYAAAGEKVAEDLRHETTHGLLHASLPGVPLWLDEGLAEYFETPTPGDPNGDYPELLSAARAAGWRPDLRRLESLTDFAGLTRRDYAESWAWVHHALTSDPAPLLSHLADLGPGGVPRTSYGDKLAAAGRPAVRLTAHVETLAGTGEVTGRAP